MRDKASTLVMFGATGDLARRMLLPSLFGLDSDGLLPDDLRVIGTARTEFDDAAFRQKALEAITEHFPASAFDRAVADRFLKRLHYIPLDIKDPAGFERLASAVGDPCNGVAIFLSTAPSLFKPTIDGLEGAGLACPTVRMALEKPLGTDLDSSREINDSVASAFPEDRTFRIDHYLGKETVQNLLALRFANLLFEPLWNSNYVDHVQITMAEDIGIAGRAGYYDGIGAARDVIQNHLIQLLALTAMEEPVSFSASDLRAEKEKVLSAVRLPKDLAKATARGQYAAGWQGGEQVMGYLDEDGIANSSTTETYAAIKLEIDTRRWAGVPFYLRTGKRLGKRVSEIAVVFKRAPHLPFERTATGEL